MGKTDIITKAAEQQKQREQRLRKREEDEKRKEEVKRSQKLAEKRKQEVGERVEELEEKRRRHDAEVETERQGRFESAKWRMVGAQKAKGYSRVNTALGDHPRADGEEVARFAADAHLR